MDKLLTQQDLADRWQVSLKSIESYRQQGIITPIKDIPSIRFNPEQIAELEGTKLERFSPLARKQLEKEIEALQKENEKLKNILSKTLVNLAPVINL